MSECIGNQYVTNVVMQTNNHNRPQTLNLKATKVKSSGLGFRFETPGGVDWRDLYLGHTNISKMKRVMASSGHWRGSIWSLGALLKGQPLYWWFLGDRFPILGGGRGYFWDPLRGVLAHKNWQVGHFCLDFAGGCVDKWVTLGCFCDVYLWPWKTKK